MKPRRVVPFGGEPEAVGRCPVTGCGFSTVVMAASRATRAIVRHLHEVHEAPGGKSYDDTVAEFYSRQNVERDRADGLGGSARSTTHQTTPDQIGND